MALGTIAAIAGGVKAVGGAIAGAGGSKQTTVKNLLPESDIERQARNLSSSQLRSLQSLVGSGAGQADVTAGAQAQRDFASQLQAASQTGGVPTAADLATGQSFAQSAFAPRQIALQQSFEQQEQRTAQLAAQLGREVDDPILQAKLAQEQTRQQSVLSAEQAAFGTQFAQDTTGRRLEFARQRAGVLAGLGGQAISQTAGLLQASGSILGQERQFRSSVAGETTKSGGGLGGAITGAIGGFGAGAEIGRDASKIFSGGGTSLGRTTGAPTGGLDFFKGLA